LTQLIQAGKIDAVRLPYEADVAYCAKIYAEKYKAYNGKMTGVTIFDEEGNPYRLKYPEIAAYKRDLRRRTSQKNPTETGRSKSN
jgi:hypothetical protein